MEKLNLLNKLEEKNWQEIINNPEQLKARNQLKSINNFNNKENLTTAQLEEILVHIEVNTKILNKYEKENIKPIKDYINSYRKIILDYEAETTKLGKTLKVEFKKLIDDKKEKEIIKEIKEHKCICIECGKEF